MEPLKWSRHDPLQDDLERVWLEVYPDRARPTREGITCSGCGLPAYVVWTPSLCGHCLQRELTDRE